LSPEATPDSAALRTRAPSARASGPAPGARASGSASGSPAGRRYDALIIGAGMSGLAAGIRLAQFDKRVAILEQHSLWGGLNSFYKLGGRLFDSGLHALTNFAARGQRAAPLNRALRQLRIPYDALELGEQTHSEICFPGTTLRFSNNFELLRSEVARAFPSQVDGFERLVHELPAYEDFGGAAGNASARGELERRLSDPLLREMLFLPLAYYGSAREHDLDWDQFAILFRSIYLEGLSRPEGGIQSLLALLVERFRGAGGELKLRTGVSRIVVEDQTARRVILDDGTELEAEEILSSAGWLETLRLCGAGELEARSRPEDAGRLSFLESIWVLDRPPSALESGGLDAAVTFFNDSERFHYRRPDDFCDPRSGVLCTPNNFARREPLDEGWVRISALADHARWCALDEESYRAQKKLESARVLASAARWAPPLAHVRAHTVFEDVFTPRTIEHFTRHVNGAVYGSPRKRKDGATGIANLHLCGTDQGLLGIVGAMLSGITMANRHVLERSAAS
jgi:phytoene dehydrogenase-like protein